MPNIDRTKIAIRGLLLISSGFPKSVNYLGKERLMSSEPREQAKEEAKVEEEERPPQVTNRNKIFDPDWAFRDEELGLGIEVVGK